MIRFRCACGKMLNAKDEAAGKRVRCPACGEPIQVPQAPSADSDIRLAGHDHPSSPIGGLSSLCPHCHTTLPASVVICTTCGLNLRTGEMPVVPKTFFEKIPWKTIARTAGGLAAIVAVAVLCYLAYQHFQKKRQRLSEDRPIHSSGPAEGPTTAAGKAPTKPPGEKPRQIRICVRTRTKWPQATFAKGFTLQCADKAYEAREACELLRSKLSRRAILRLRAGDHNVVAANQLKPDAGFHTLTFRVHIDLGWLYQKGGEKLLPLKPYVASCKAALVAEGDASVWESKEPFTAFGYPPDNEQLAALAQIKSAKTNTNLADYTDQLAAAVAMKAFADIPDPLPLAKLVTEARNRRK